MRRAFLLTVFSFACFFGREFTAAASGIIFCGEEIPVDRDFVADRLIVAIRQQMPVATLSALRAKALNWFPFIESELRKKGVPADFKYLPIVESGFTNAYSPAGAVGLWQFMYQTAIDCGLIVVPGNDQRLIPERATVAAALLLSRYHQHLLEKHGVDSWVLTAAAYNYGSGNMAAAIHDQGKDYFSMQLNDETAAYVYKIIAVKELFEHPQRYLKGFGRNIFDAASTPKEISDEEVAKLKKGKLELAGKSTFALGADAEAKAAMPKHTIVIPITVQPANGIVADNTGYIITFGQDANFPKGASYAVGYQLTWSGYIIDGRLRLEPGEPGDIELSDLFNKAGMPLDYFQNGIAHANLVVIDD